jgi:predicted TIM-barrel fold metal-dependent hydrolase
MKLIDAHVHTLCGVENNRIVYDTADEFGMDFVNILSVPAYDGMAQNAEAAYYKWLRPERTFAFAGLEYTSGRPFEDQARAMWAMGFDGFKMIEGKPTVRKAVGIPLDSPRYDAFYAFLEENGIALLLHAADPKDFWDEDLIPQWAKDANMLYREDDIPYEQLYREVEGILLKHPRLKLILAHFYFLSDDMPRARRMLDAHPNVCFDLTSGTEMYLNFSKDPEGWKPFFEEYAGRLVFGTDSTDNPDPRDGVTKRIINGMQLGFLRTAEPFKAWENVIRGVALGEDPLQKILSGNFERLVGARPRPLDQALFLREIGALTEAARASQDGGALSKLEAIRAAVEDGPAGEDAPC